MNLRSTRGHENTQRESLNKQEASDSLLGRDEQGTANSLFKGEGELNDGFGYRDAFAWALYFAPNDAMLHFRIGSYMWGMGDISGLPILQESINLDPSLRRHVERLLRK